MADLEMTVEEREAFVAGLHVGILSIARTTRAPLAVPVWYLYEDGDIVMSMDGTSLKARLLRTAGRASFTVQNETPPYQYVMAEGPVELTSERRDNFPLASRYLGPELGRWYADN